jgi:hypothetical protein
MAKIEDRAIRLARDVYESILQSVIPQPLMESVGKAIVSETKWEKLNAQQKVALFRVASILEGKLTGEATTSREQRAIDEAMKPQGSAEPTDSGVAGDNVATSEVK